MRKFKKLTLTLALLLTAVGGAWAQSSLNVVELEAPAEWDTDDSNLTPADLPGFYTSTFDKAKAWTGAPAEGSAMLIYAFEGDDAHYVYFDKGTPEDKDYTFTFTKASVLFMTKIYYTVEPANPTEWLLTPDKTGKTWTLAKMPASNVELQVEYEPTKVTMAANDNAMGTVEVASGSKVEWTPDTWKGWTASTKEHTVDDITMTSSQTAYINESTEAGDYLHSLSFFVKKWDTTSTVTFSTTGDPFSRIEFTMIEDYSDDWNPSILPNDNWTFEGKSAVWEGEATKSLTLQSCTTFVSKITFYQGGAIPDGVTVNGDGTFTVAKTATVTLKATPAEGYKFLYWEDDQTNTNPVREVTIESGMADKTYKAVFAEILYNVTFVEGTNLDEWTATPDTEVKKDAKVDIKYTGAKKVIGVKVEKKPEPLIVNPIVGQVIGSDGKNYDANATLPDGVKAVAMIAYVGNDAETSTTYNHGLALALENVSGAKVWCYQTDATCLGTQYDGGTKINDLSGIANTDALVNNTGHTHEAASAARGYNSGIHPDGTSAWFLPSAGQWYKMVTAAGDYATLKTNAGLQSSSYWSSTESGADKAWRFSFSNGGWNNSSKVSALYVRACLAF